MKENKKENHSMPAQVILYVICAALVLFYCMDLWWGLKPDVGPEYEMYYISHELSDWPGYGNLKYTYGTKELCIERNEKTIAETPDVICARKGRGFEKPEKTGTRSSQKDSYVYYIPEKDAQKAVFKAEISEFEGDIVNVYAQDTLIGSITAAGSYEFDMSDIRADELLKIHFENNNSNYRLYSIEIDS